MEADNSKDGCEEWLLRSSKGEGQVWAWAEGFWASPGHPGEVIWGERQGLQGTAGGDEQDVLPLAARSGEEGAGWPLLLLGEGREPAVKQFPINLRVNEGKSTCPGITLQDPIWVTGTRGVCLPSFRTGAGARPRGKCPPAEAVLLLCSPSEHAAGERFSPRTGPNTRPKARKTKPLLLVTGDPNWIWQLSGYSFGMTSIQHRL